MNSKTDTNPFFSVILLNWNGGDCLEACLASLAAQSFRLFELICIDNASTDASRAKLHSYTLEEYVNVPAQCYFNDKNIGFAAGMNAGIRRAKGAWILPLNVDTELADDFLEKAHAVITKNPEYALIGAHVLAYENMRTDSTLCTGVWLTRHMSIRTLVEPPFTDSSYRCFGPAGCAPLISHEALRAAALPEHLTASGQVEFYDERYFAYGEDVDLYFRLNVWGYTCLYSPEIRLWHRHSATQKGVKWSTKDAKTLARLPANAVATICKNAPLKMLFSHACLIAAIPFLMSLRLIFTRPQVMWAPLIGIIRSVRQLPGTFLLRKHIQSNSKSINIHLLFTPDTHRS